jgi:hypothetical protein
MPLPETTGETARRIADEIVADLRENLRDAWNDLTEAERYLLVTVANDVARVSLLALAMPFSGEAADVYRRELNHSLAQVANVGVARQLHLARGLMQAATNVLARAGQVAGAALIAAL